MLNLTRFKWSICCRGARDSIFLQVGTEVQGLKYYSLARVSVMVFIDLFTSAFLILLMSQALDQRISYLHEQSLMFQ